MELQKCLGSAWFWAVLGLMCLVSAAAALDAIGAYEQFQLFSSQDASYDYLSSESCFVAWVGVGTWGRAGAYTLFYYALVLLAPLAYAWSSASELGSGYAFQALARVPHVDYYAAKGIVAFISALCIGAIPLLLNLLMIACVFPAYVPDVYDSLYTGVYRDTPFSGWFYTIPTLFVCARVLVVCALVGSWTLFVCALGTKFRNRVLVFTVPYLGLLALEYINHSVFVALGNRVGVEVSPFNLMQTIGYAYPHEPAVILAEAALLLVVAGLIFWHRAKGDTL